jgi:phenylpropionate dioxygenase-like ring-hydroxylating dioxygenase large terminal subunit
MRDNCGTLNQNWYAACTSAELGKDKPLGRMIMEEMIVLFRDQTGHPVALLDRCLHRNALLSEGEVFDGCIGCPYHGWTYNHLGQVVNIPSEGPETYVRPDKTIVRFPTRDAHGLVWVWMGDPERVTGEPFPMPWYQEDGWMTYYMITPFNNNVTNLAENYMDVPHTVFVHSKWFRNAKRVRGEALAVRTRHSVEITYYHQDDIGFADWALNPDRLPMVHTDKFYMPNVTRVDYSWGDKRHFVISSQITPVRPYESMVYTAIAFKFGWLTPLLKPFFSWYTRKVITQDVEIMDVQVKALKHYGAEFMSTEADVVHEYIESLRDHAESGEVGPTPEPEERRISFWI